jgi:hypothetical protein
MSKEDWIILRLLKVGVRGTSYGMKFSVDPDVVKAILYLHKKYGRQGLSDAIDKLGVSND